MGKLFTLKKWVLLSDAATRLSSSFDENVSERDIIQLALGGHLQVSIRLLASHLYAFRWDIKQRDEVDYEEVEDPFSGLGGHSDKSTNKIKMPIGGKVIHLSEFCQDDEVLQLGTCPISYARDYFGRDILDLPITNYSRRFLLQCFDELSGGSCSSDCYINQLLVQEESGDLWQIESDSDSLLSDIELVVRTKVLIDFEQAVGTDRVAENLIVKDEINPRKEEALYKLIIGMAQGGYGYDPNAPKNSTVSDIQRDLDQLGIGLGERTIRNHLKAAKAYLPTKPVKP